MSWRDNLRHASFRGVPFQIEAVESSFGRRQAVHEYPLRDEPFVEDLGERAQEFHVSGYVVQRVENAFDYFTERDLLIQALRKSGPGTLVHPWLGEMQVNVLGQARIQETFAEGGVAKFDITFVQAGESKLPAISIDHPATITTTTYASWNKVKVGWLDRLKLRGAEFLKEGLLGDIVNGYQKVRSAIMEAKEFTQDIRSEAIGLVNSVQTELASVMASPLDIIGNIQSAFVAFESFEQVPGNMVSVIKGLLGISEDYGSSGLTTIPTTTATRAVQQANRDLTVKVFKAAAIIGSVKAASEASFTSAEQAIETMRDIIDAMDATLLEIAEADSDYSDDEIYQAIEALRPVAVRAMKEFGATLTPILTEYKLAAGGPTPLLVLVHDLYDDLEMEEDVILRNRPKIRHPGFPPAGEVLTVKTFQQQLSGLQNPITATTGTRTMEIHQNG